MTILRSIGLGFRVVGSLDLANNVLNPKFANFNAGAFDNWFTFGRATVSAQTDYVAFGTQACKITIASGTSTASGIQQNSIPVVGGENYTTSASFYVGSALPTYIDISLTYYDSALTLISSTGNLHMTTGAATGGNYVRASVPTTAPDMAATINLTIQITTGSAVNFYVDGVRHTAGQAVADAAYLDGDFSSYVWSGQPDASTTLESTPPDALYFFATGGPVTPTPVVS